jgi:peptidoglycan hydrolase-like protein with peptidoglycan-binding domain
VITWLRRTLPLLLAVAVTAAGPAAITPALAAPDDYRGAVDITFPTVAQSTYRDDYANPRSGGRVHRATDIFARAGAPVYAARGGRVVWLPQTEQGNAGFGIQIAGDDGRTYAYYHLGPAGGTFGQAVVRTIKLGSTIKRGDRIGLLGDSGNARGGAPHLHFEILDRSVVDPYGSNRRNPYASLRRAQGLPVEFAPTPTPPVSTGPPTLRRGDRGPAVTAWQNDLNQTRYGAEIAADGSFGPTTERATKVFQHMAGLGPGGLGIVGPKTRRALAEWVAAGKAGTAAAASRPAEQASRTKAPAPTTTAKPAATAAPILRLGDRGPAVKKWQRRLNRTRVGNELGVDGAFGPRTERATIIFQRSVGLGPQGLGIVGPKTRRALTRVLQAG